ncbi:MAG: helix-turn-helix transcriptional regulator [bacterium]|nr:helix-turn-helix transcriptional regulator [bacterium]
MNVAYNIKKFRNLAHISQEKLAEKVSLTRNYLALLESGRREPSISALNRISKALNVPTSILVLEIKEDVNNPLDKLLMRAYELATKDNR